MKKLLFCIVLMLLPILASANPVEVEGVWYNLIPKGQVAEVTNNPSGDNYSGDVTILDKFTYDGVEYSVTKILENAFSGCNGLNSVTIGNCVESIGDYAFSTCSRLTSVTIPNSVESIGEAAFIDCDGLTSVTIPNSVTSIGKDAFRIIYSNLTSVHISDIKAWCAISFYNQFSNPLYYAHHLYLNGEEIKDLIIPNSVETISQYAFIDCDGLTSVTIPNSVKSIGRYAFSDCDGLTSVHISDIKAWCETYFGDNPLASAQHLYLNGEEIKDLVIPNSVKSISKDAFLGCESLTSVTIPNSVTSIGDFAFYGCKGLTSVHISDIKAWCETYFGDNPLAYAHHLYLNGEEIKDLVIPNSVKSISSSAFAGCSSLTSVIIGNSVESIGSWAFGECTSLTSVTIGNKVSSIDYGAFSSCGQLTNVYCLPEKIAETRWDEGLYYTADNAFENSYQEYITLHVPAALVEAYRAIEPWKYFKEVVALNGEDIPDIPATPKCATPTISLVDGKITFSCETDGVGFVSEVIVEDAKKYYDASVTLSQTYKITVYATKAGYENSDVVTREIVIGNDQTTLFGDLNKDGIVNVADHVKLSDIIMNK